MCSVYEYSVENLTKYNSSYNTQMYELSLDCKTRNILFRLSYYSYSTYKDRNYRQNKNNKSIERSKLNICIHISYFSLYNAMYPIPLVCSIIFVYSILYRMIIYTK